MKHHLDFEKPIIELQAKLEELRKHPETHSLGISFEEEVSLIEKKLEETKRQIFSNLSAWDRIKIARHLNALSPWIICNQLSLISANFMAIAFLPKIELLSAVLPVWDRIR
jgi:acetyl-CoA carboxylase alpha subunit